MHLSNVSIFSDFSLLSSGASELNIKSKATCACVSERIAIIPDRRAANNIARYIDLHSMLTRGPIKFVVFLQDVSIIVLKIELLINLIPLTCVRVAMEWDNQLVYYFSNNWFNFFIISWFPLSYVSTNHLARQLPIVQVYLLLLYLCLFLREEEVFIISSSFLAHYNRGCQSEFSIYRWSNGSVTQLSSKWQL